MMRYYEPLHLSSAADAASADPVRLAASAYLARFTGSSREQTESDLRCYLRWCADRGLDPLAARRPDLEQYIRWMQETCRFKPSTISRRFSVAAGFYRTCVIDAVLKHSPADHVRRPNVPPGSPTLGFTHLQFEALLTAARESASDYDFALVAMLGLLGLRIFEATSAGIADPGEEHGHRVLRVCGKGTKIVLVPPARPQPCPNWLSMPAITAALQVCILRRMPRMQVYLPDDLYEQVKTRHLPASELLQEAVRAEVRRQDLLGETDAYLADLLDQVGQPSQQEWARAQAIARRIAARRTSQAS